MINSHNNLKYFYFYFQAFQELQTEMIATTQQIKMADMQIEAQKRQIAHAKLVDAELTAIPEGTHTYEGIGRMYIYL